MSFKRLRLQAAKRLLRARYFVVLTDKSSMIALDGVDPEEFTDMLALYAQASALEDFHVKLNELMDAHALMLEELAGFSDDKHNITPAKKAGRAKKVPVKEG